MLYTSKIPSWIGQLYRVKNMTKLCPYANDKRKFVTEAKKKKDCFFPEICKDNFLEALDRSFVKLTTRYGPQSYILYHQYEMDISGFTLFVSIQH